MKRKLIISAGKVQGKPPFFGDSGVFRDARRKKDVWRKGAGAEQGNWLDWSHHCLYSSVLDSAEERMSRTWMYRNYCCLELWKAEFKILGSIWVSVRHTKEISFKMSFKIGSFSDFFPLPFGHTNSDLHFPVFFLQMCTLRSHSLNYLFLTGVWYYCSSPTTSLYHAPHYYTTKYHDCQIPFKFSKRQFILHNIKSLAFVLLCGFAPNCPG